VEAYLSGEKSFVKPHFRGGDSTADSISDLHVLTPIYAELLCRITISPPSFEM
jgi:hypothetical protein